MERVAAASVALPAAAPASFTVHGSGWGHGLGMSQYGAYGMALDGRSATNILEHYYEPAKVTTRTDDPTIRVQVRTGVTSVTVGRDGAVYLGELRGFPATPGTSEIWRVEPGATDAVCKPNKPQKGACTRVADGLTSIVSLASGRGGALYAAELSKKSWFAVENEVEGAVEGAVIRIGHDRDVRRELKPGKVILPGSVAVGPNGKAFVSGPIFGPGAVMKLG